jgi:hypothetical protein
MNKGKTAKNKKLYIYTYDFCIIYLFISSVNHYILTGYIIIMFSIFVFFIITTIDLFYIERTKTKKKPQ